MIGTNFGVAACLGIWASEHQSRSYAPTSSQKQRPMVLTMTAAGGTVVGSEEGFIPSGFRDLIRIPAQFIFVGGANGQSRSPGTLVTPFCEHGGMNLLLMRS